MSAQCIKPALKLALTVVMESSAFFLLPPPSSRPPNVPLATFSLLTWSLFMVLEDAHIKICKAAILAEVSHAGKDSFESTQ